MGVGDDIMATAHAEAICAQYHKKVICGDHEKGIRHWSEVFENNPNFIQPGEKARFVAFMGNYTGNRPYILEVRDRFIWNPDHKAGKGRFFFTHREKMAARKIVEPLGKFSVVEPNVKGTISGSNKRWGRFQEVITPDRKWVQFDYGQPLLEGVTPVRTETFRMACAILSHADLFLGTDGGLHHAAAALNVPAVVLWGHFSSPDILGYPDHVNIRKVEGIGCGSIRECPDCAAAMDAITPEDVLACL